MKKIIPIEKQSKKNQKKYHSAQRGTNGFNTGTRTMKTVKKPSRAMQKNAWRKGKEL